MSQEKKGRSEFEKLAEILPLLNMEMHEKTKKVVLDDPQLCKALLDLVCGSTLHRNPVESIRKSETSPGKRVKISESVVRAREISDDLFRHIYEKKEGLPPVFTHGYERLCDLVQRFMTDFRDDSPFAERRMCLQLAEDCALPTMGDVHQTIKHDQCNCMDRHDHCITNGVEEPCGCDILHILRNENMCGGLMDHIKALVHEEQSASQFLRWSTGPSRLLAGLAAQICILQMGITVPHDASLHSYVDEVRDQELETGVMYFDVCSCKGIPFKGSKILTTHEVCEEDANAKEDDGRPVVFRSYEIISVTIQVAHDGRSICVKAEVLCNDVSGCFDVACPGCSTFATRWPKSKAICDKYGLCCM